MMLRKLKRAQGVAEYVIFITAVLIGLIALQIYYQRAVKGNVKTRADSVGDQFTMHGEDYSYETRTQSNRETIGGYDTTTGNPSWSTSVIKSNITQTFGKALTASPQSKLMKIQGTSSPYRGIEYSSSDYVNATINAGNLGSHGNFSSGDLTANTPLEEGGQDQ